MNTVEPFLNCVIHGDCIHVMRSLPAECVDLVVTDPPYLANHVSRNGRSMANDDNRRWLKPAFAEIFRLLKPDRYCVSFYGWNQAERFLWQWKRTGFVPVGHLTFVKDYASKCRFTLSHHENAYVLAKGEPQPPLKPIRDVLPWIYTGNRLHPTQKPVTVISPLIQAFSQPGDVVLDPFGGSGTTAVAARECARRFILIEKVWRYYETARNRLNTIRPS